VTLSPVALTPAAVREALERRGMDAARADAAACGIQPAAVMFDALKGGVRDAVALAAHEQGLACLTGADWALLTGTLAQLAGLTRAGGSADLDDSLASELGRTLSRLAEPPVEWEMARGTVLLDRPRVVGILNVTPDSFSDGGHYVAAGDAIDHAARMVDAGADLLDVGAESTRPGQPDPVSVEEEWGRLAPVLPALVARFPQIPISVDTVKAETARRAADAGVWAVNDVTGLRHDPALADVCARTGMGLVLMHSRGDLSSIASYEHATYDDLSLEVLTELNESIAHAERWGVGAARIVIDPGLGFAKRPEHNLAVLQRLTVLGACGRPIMVGPSRKRFLGVVTATDHPEDRDVATAAACVAAYERGARLFRVHAVAPTRQALAVAHAIRAA